MEEGKVLDGVLLGHLESCLHVDDTLTPEGSCRPRPPSWHLHPLMDSFSRMMLPVMLRGTQPRVQDQVLNLDLASSGCSGKISLITASRI